jgi:hypothetical protein
MSFLTDSNRFFLNGKANVASEVVVDWIHKEIRVKAHDEK